MKRQSQLILKHSKTRESTTVTAMVTVMATVMDTTAKDTVGNKWLTASLKKWVSTQRLSKNSSSVERTNGLLPTEIVAARMDTGRTRGLFLSLSRMRFLRPVPVKFCFQASRSETLLTGHGNRDASSEWTSQLTSKTCRLTS